jgi:hemolysin activation/secretion protein
MKRPHWLLLPLIAISPAVLAAAPAPAALSAPAPTGGALQLPTPGAVHSGGVPPLVMQPTKPLVNAPEAPEAQVDRLKIVVKSLRIEGAQVFALAELIGVCGFVPGTAYTLTEVRAMAARIERHYQTNGYPVAQAYLPAQDILDGAITLTVAEGHYGQVLVRNASHVSAEVIAGVLQDIQTGDRVTADALESQLLLLSDLPGVQIKSALVPGATFGSSDLMLDVLPGRRVTGSVDADNAGNYYTGALRVGATIFLNEPTGAGDVASLRLLTSGQGLNYFRAAYQLQVGQARVGAAYSSLEYALGQEFENLLANGTAQSIGFFGSYPLLRSRDANLFFGASYESKRFEDRLDSVGSSTEKAAHVLTASLSGDRRDALGAGASSAFALTLSSGDLSIQTAAARAFDASTAQTNGHFNKLGYSASYLQNLSPRFALYAGLNGQMAAKNLDASEKMELGGMFAVRAYPEGEAYGDAGYVLNLEARWLLTPGSTGSTGAPWARWTRGQWQLVGFVDLGSVTLNQNPWSTEPNQRRLSGAGIGLNWAAADQFQLRLAYAHKLADEPARSAPDANDRLWLQAIKYF